MAAAEAKSTNVLLAALIVLASAQTDTTLVRTMIADTARAQLQRMDDAWPAEQRDCAGFVRYVYRRAYTQVAPAKVQRGLFKTRKGPSAFADAETLLSGGSFRGLGRDIALRESLVSGDLVAFRRVDSAHAEPIYHVMLVLRAQDPAHGDTWVVYHPGSPNSSVRGGRLRDLEREAPLEWQPVPENPAFLGYFRYEEWMR